MGGGEGEWGGVGVCAYLSLTGNRREVGWGGRLFEGRLLFEEIRYVAVNFPSQVIFIFPVFQFH